MRRVHKSRDVSNWQIGALGVLALAGLHRMIQNGMIATIAIGVAIGVVFVLLTLVATYYRSDSA